MDPYHPIAKNNAIIIDCDACNFKHITIAKIVMAIIDIIMSMVAINFFIFF